MKIREYNQMMGHLTRKGTPEEINDLQKENMDLLWDLAKMEKRLAEAEKVESEVANYEKKITKFINEESVDN